MLSDRLALKKRRLARQSRNRLLRYRPFPKQRAFHDSGAIHRERMLLAGNQCGKTTCGAAEAAMHLTGRYRPDWQGKRFDKPTRGWVGSDGFQAVRDAAQRLLIGPPENESEWGTGISRATT